MLEKLQKIFREITGATDIELTEKTTICLVIMNPKNSSYSESQEILVDDAKLVKM